MVSVSSADALVHEPLAANLHRRRALLQSTPVNDGVIVWIGRPNNAILHRGLHDARRFLGAHRRAKERVVIENVLPLELPLELGAVKTRGVLEIRHDARGRRAREVRLRCVDVIESVIAFSSFARSFARSIARSPLVGSFALVRSLAPRPTRDRLPSIDRSRTSARRIALVVTDAIARRSMVVARACAGARRAGKPHGG